LHQEIVSYRSYLFERRKAGREGGRKEGNGKDGREGRIKEIRERSRKEGMDGWMDGWMEGVGGRKEDVRYVKGYPP
jgi:hypothetical protein